jgi:hypothetical protein
MKDELDTQTLEIPLRVPPIHVLEKVLARRPRTLAEKWLQVQIWENQGRRTADLEMLIAVRDWKRKQERYKPPFIIKDNRYIWQL